MTSWQDESAPLPAGRSLPVGYTDLEQRRSGSGQKVLVARRDGSQVVLRFGGEGGAGEAELAILAAVRHPGLARLVDHGSLPGGESYVARSWIEGIDLQSWSDGRTPLELGRVVASLCPALEHLHASGFVHADLKGGNVIVRPDGRAVLTDFGLSRALGAAGAGVSGTLYSIAPEVLLGGSADARSDLFALGVLLHELLSGRRVSAREFYARFPQEDFFSASGSAPADLPDWARDVVARLVAVDPAHRLQSAAAVGRLLADRLELPELSRELALEEESLRWPTRFGREDFFEQHCRRLAAQPSQPLTWLRVSAHEDAVAVLSELSLVCALQGASVRTLDLTRELDRVVDPASLDRWVANLVRDHGTACLFVAPSARGTATDAWHLRATMELGRAIELSGGGRPQLVVGCSQVGPASLEWQRADLDEPTAEDVERFLSSAMPAEPSQRMHAFSRVLHEAAGRSARTLDRALADARREGWIVAGASGPRLRPGPLPESLTLGRSSEQLALDSLADPARRVLAALFTAGGNARVDELLEFADLDARVLPGLLDELAGAGWIERQPSGLRLRVGSVPYELLAEADWRALFARRASQLEARSAPPAVLARLRFRAGELTAEELVSRARVLRDDGMGEVALELCEGVRREALRCSWTPDARIEGERALCWCVLGDLERATSIADEIEAANASDPLLQALCERVRGSIAAARHEYDRALEHFARALELDPSDRGESLLGQAQLYFELRRDEEVCALTVPSQVSPRIASLTRTFQAMSHLRLGRLERARGMLDVELEQALAAGDAGRIAGLRINLGTLERRSGNLTAAIEHFEEAVAHCERSGVLTRLAEARSLFAAALREAGELRRAEPMFTSALAIRERLGDVRGAHVVRGMLGLLYAERGHARAAIETLQRATQGLRAAGRRSDAYLLAERCSETRARIGAAQELEPGSSGSDDAAGGDPRVLIAAARARALRGARDEALELVNRAGELGQALGVAHVRAEARLLAYWLAPERPSGDPDEFPAGSLIEQDQRLLVLLDEPAWDDVRAAAAHDLAAELERGGRDDRAARLWLAVAERARDATSSDAAVARAESLLEVCGAGLTALEAQALRTSLLGMPDPWPHELQTRVSTPEESEMELLSLLEINHRLLSQDEIGGLLGTIVEQSLSVSGAERGFLILEQDGELRIDTAMDSRRGGMDATEVELSGSILREALRAMEPVRISNAVDDPLLGGAPSVVALDLRSVLCVPFKVDASLRGIIYVDHRVREDAFDERSERLLRLLAGQAALAILQVRRLEEIRSLNSELSRHVVSVESDLRTARKALHTIGLPAPAGGLVGSSQVMRDVHRLLERAAPNKLPVLICGPSGTGKELAARALHDLSDRSKGPFVTENCAALPPTLIEAELFGAMRGAFTGADRDRAGLFERAHGGTLFLDEIGELPIDLQAKLLRVLETSQVRRIGDSGVRSVDFRLLAATNRELEQEVSEERFRADLFYRLDGLRVRMPSLAARKEDIPELVDHCLRLQAATAGEQRRISDAVLARLCRRDWPGNVRELFNELARLCVMCEGDLDDPELVRETALVSAIRADSIRTLADVEREAIERTLELTGGDKRRAADMLGISRAKIYQRLKEWRKEE